MRVPFRFVLVLALVAGGVGTASSGSAASRSADPCEERCYQRWVRCIELGDENDPAHFDRCYNQYQGCVANCPV
jgi:hypothetical protein